MRPPTDTSALRRAGPWLVARWQQLTWGELARGVLLLLLTVGAVVHNAVLWTWFVEDAAISFAYARHLAMGEGLVPFVGGERVEGYSNPTWVALLALFELVGWSAESSARWLQLALAGATVPLVYGIGREAAPREHSPVPLLAAAILAVSPQFAIWGSSGLENGLFNFLLAGALWRLAVEARTGTFPWSAAWFFLLAISRPEAVLYAAVGAAGVVVFHLHARRGITPILKWAAVFGLPFVAYHLWRYNYFAWAWPNTYYAKLGDHREPKPLQWDRAGWKYVRNWAADVGTGVFLPVYLLGVVGGRGWRALIGITVAMLVSLTILLPSDQRLLLPVVLAFCYAVFYTSMRWQSGRPHPAVVWLGLVLVGGFIGAAEVLRSLGAESSLDAPEWMATAPPYALLAAFLLLPLAGAGPRGWQARWACWGTGGVAVFFACYALGDWMKGFRWMSMLTVPGSVILACGMVAVGDMAQTVLGRREHRWGVAGWLVTVGLLAAFVPSNIAHTQWFDSRRETSPYSVKRRVEYMAAAGERMHIHERIVALDVDQGAHLWWSDWRMLDIAGLVDVPMAQNRFRKPFIREYLFQEHRPHFAHVHGGWASSSRIPTHAEWREGYIEIPGYGTGKSLHIGNHVRRDLIMQPSWAGPEGRSATFDGEVRLAGWDIPSPEAAIGRRFYVEVGVGTTKRRRASEGFRVLLFLADRDRLATWDLPVAYDWIRPDKWGTDEIFHGRFSPQLPDDLPVGTYDLGLVILDAKGGVLPVQDAPPGAIVGVEGQARVAAGELRFPGALKVVSRDRLSKEVAADVERATQRASEGACADAERAWFEARMHHPRATTWVAQWRPRTGRAIADCWVAAAAADPDAEVDHLARARTWDHRAPSLLTAARPVADRLHAEGLAAREERRWDDAYRRFSEVLSIDASRSWSRRYAEEARAYRLGHDPETRAREAAERLETQRKHREAREKLEERRRERDEQVPSAPDADE